MNSVDNTQSIRQLETFVIDNPQLDHLETLIAEFNIFEALGAVRQELRHSDFLAFLLNPSEKHGLDDRFLKRFLIRVLTSAAAPPVTPIHIDVTDLSHATVERESQHIDILIHDAASGIVCIIENKIFSDEHSNQLDRYHQLVRGRFPQATIIPVFLTPDGGAPEDEDSPYIPFSYGEMATIIDQVREAQASMLGTDVNTLMQHYVAMLRRYIVSDSPIAELCQQIYQTHKAAIDLIIEHKPDQRQELAAYLAQLVRAQPELNVMRETKTYVNFTLNDWASIPQFWRGTGWAGSNATLSFQFINHQPDRLGLYLYIGRVRDEDQAIRQAIFDHANSNRKVFTGCRPSLAPQWTYIYKTIILQRKDYTEDNTLEDYIALIEPKWQHFLRDVLPEINQHLMQINFQ